jgi:hypothetical protein
VAVSVDGDRANIDGTQFKQNQVLAAQPAPVFEVDQRVNSWANYEAATQARYWGVTVQ